MPVYCFSIQCEPTAGARQAADIQGANAEVWVVGATMEEAEIKARSYLLDYAWMPTSVEYALQPTPEQIARLDKSVQALHQEALHQGVAAVLLAWPKVEGQDDDPIEIRSMGAPVKPTDQEQ